MASPAISFTIPSLFVGATPAEPATDPQDPQEKNATEIDDALLVAAKSDNQLTVAEWNQIGKRILDQWETGGLIGLNRFLHEAASGPWRIDPKILQRLKTEEEKCLRGKGGSCGIRLDSIRKIEERQAGLSLLTKKSDLSFWLTPEQWKRIKEDPLEAPIFAAMEKRGLHFDEKNSLVTVETGENGRVQTEIELVFDDNGDPSDGGWVVGQLFGLRSEDTEFVTAGFRQVFQFAAGKGEWGSKGNKGTEKRGEGIKGEDLQPSRERIKAFENVVPRLTLARASSEAPVTVDFKAIESAIRVPHFLDFQITVNHFKGPVISSSAWQALIGADLETQTAFIRATARWSHNLIMITLDEFLLREISRVDPERAVQILVALRKDLSWEQLRPLLYAMEGDVVSTLKKVGSVDPQFESAFVKKFRYADLAIFKAYGGFQYAGVIHTRAEYEEKVLKSKGPVVVDYGASWCAPCQLMAIPFDVVAEQFRGKGVVFYSYEMDEEKKGDEQFVLETMERYVVNGQVPVINIFVDGKKVDGIDSLYNELLRDSLKTDRGRPTGEVIRDFVVRTLGLDPETLEKKK